MTTCGLAFRTYVFGPRYRVTQTGSRHVGVFYIFQGVGFDVPGPEGVLTIYVVVVRRGGRVFGVAETWVVRNLDGTNQVFGGRRLDTTRYFHPTRCTTR